MSEFQSFPGEPQAGFDRPQMPRDDYAAELYERFALGEAPSLAEIEPVATTLLGDHRTLFEGMSLVLGRRVDTTEIMENPELGMCALVKGAGEKFALLLLMKSFAPSEQPTTD